MLMKNTPVVAVQMTDHDVVSQVALMLGVSVTSTNRATRPHHKLIFTARVRGRRAADWMTTLRPLMSERRKTQIDKALAGWIQHKKHLYPEEVVEIIDCFQRGEKAPVIAERFEIRRETIYQILRRNGIHGR